MTQKLFAWRASTFCFIFMAASFHAALAQTSHYCGTQKPDAKLVQDRNLSDEQIHLNSSKHVPIVAHVFEKNGERLLTDEEVVNNINQATVHFDFLPTSFEVEKVTGFSGEAYENLSPAEGSDLLKSFNKSDQHKIHLVFVPSQSDVCGLTSLPPSSTQGILLSAGSGCTLPVVIAHELGHFFLLPHTHEGAGTPGAELVSRDTDNCQYKGDGLCDTPADPTLGNYNVTSACEYSGHKKDVAGEFYLPDTLNLMSYTRDTCANRFSSDQQALVEQVYKTFVVDPENPTGDIDIGVQITELFPNPLRGENLTIRYQSKNSIRVSISIVNELGQVLGTRTDVPSADGYGEMVWTFDETLRAGSYFVIVTTVRGSKGSAKILTYSP